MGNNFFISKMTIHINDNREREWIVEKHSDEGSKVIGKVITNQPGSLLNDNNLETIWELSNWSVSYPTPCDIEKGSIYAGMSAYKIGDFVYIVMSNDGITNDDIFIRKHYDLDNGFFLYSNKPKTMQRWTFGDRKTWQEFMKTPLHIRR